MGPEEPGREMDILATTPQATSHSGRVRMPIGKPWRAGAELSCGDWVQRPGHRKLPVNSGSSPSSTGRRDSLVKGGAEGERTRPQAGWGWAS